MMYIILTFLDLVMEIIRYPSDGEKNLLALRSGLTRSQVMEELPMHHLG